LVRCYVLPISWIPDVYINPSNNGNLQSSKYKEMNTGIKRTNKEFIKILHREMIIAQKKRSKKAKKK